MLVKKFFYIIQDISFDNIHNWQMSEKKHVYKLWVQRYTDTMFLEDSLAMATQV